MKTMVRLAAGATAVLALSACGGGSTASRDQIKVVGSSTVYPFTTAVAENFVNTRKMKAPVIESTGTGAGVKLFCAGAGPQHPDVLNASRRLKKSEFEGCAKNGVTEIMEIQIGTDGIALGESNAGQKFQVTRKDLYLALAAMPGGKPNTAKMWRDVNPSLPAVPITVYGPPSTSGTRDAFVELIMETGCQAADPSAKELKSKDEEAYKKLCTAFRDDGAYVDKGENDNLIVQNLVANPNAVGIFGYSYLEENLDKLHGTPIEGVSPTYETISGGTYPGARPLFIYVKKAHLKAVPGLKEFVDDYAAAWNPDGPLVKRGLIAGTQAQRDASAKIVTDGTVMNGADLH